MRATCPANLVALDLICLIISGDVCQISVLGSCQKIHPASRLSFLLCDKLGVYGGGL
jgi:hypothetical protein